jgi:hypothetical protein
MLIYARKDDQFLSLMKDYISLLHLFFLILLNYLFKKDRSYDDNDNKII